MLQICRIFRVDPLIPKPLEIFWDFDCVLRGAGERAHSEGMLFLTNIQQFYERRSANNDDEPEELTAMLGSKPPSQKLEITDFGERIGRREGHLMVIVESDHPPFA